MLGDNIYRLFEIITDNLFVPFRNVLEDFGYWISTILNGFMNLLFYMFSDRQFNSEEAQQLKNYIPYFDETILSEIICFSIGVYFIYLLIKLFGWLFNTFVELSKNLKEQMKINAYLNKKGGRKKIKL